MCSPTAWQVVSETNAYAYDSVGNRKDNGGQCTTGNRITAFGSCTAFAHDDNGNMTSRTCGGVTTTYTWRKDNKLASVSSGGTTYYLRYDALGRLTRLDQGGTAVGHFLWQGGNLLAELNGSGTAIQLEYSYYPGLDNLHAVKKDSVWMAHKDPRGNVIALTNSTTKSVGQTYRYSSWGERTWGGAAGFNNLDRARWKGALWFEEIGLYYMRARWYDPSLGRFISEDPIGLAGGINPYAYASSDPINGSDPTGLLADDNPFNCKTLECWQEWMMGHCTFSWGKKVGVCGSSGDAWVLDPIDVFAPGGGGFAPGGSFGGFGGPRNGFEVHWERMGLVKQRHAEQFDEFMCHAGNVGTVVASGAVDAAIIVLYVQGGYVVARVGLGALWVAQGTALRWATGSGLILTAGGSNFGVTGTQLIGAGSAYARTQAGLGALNVSRSTAATMIGTTGLDALSPLLPVNAWNAVQNWRSCG